MQKRKYVLNISLLFQDAVPLHNLCTCRVLLYAFNKYTSFHPWSTFLFGGMRVFCLKIFQCLLHNVLTSERGWMKTRHFSSEETLQPSKEFRKVSGDFNMIAPTLEYIRWRLLRKQFSLHIHLKIWRQIRPQSSRAITLTMNATWTALKMDFFTGFLQISHTSGKWLAYFHLNNLSSFVFFYSN